MKANLLLTTCLMLLATISMAQEVAYQEYNLDNGLHVILHQDNSAPVVTTSVMYHVGAKDENENKTGFAHFFEHLLFEGTANIERGEWFKSCLPTVDRTMQIPRKTAPIITKSFLRTI